MRSSSLITAYLHLPNPLLPHVRPHSSMKTPHILIVDDEPNIVMSLEFLMRKNGYQVGIARNGTEALAAIDQTPYDLVLLDIMMPDVDGYQVCQQLRQQPDRAGTKVIFLSAKSQRADIQKGLRSGSRPVYSQALQHPPADGESAELLPAACLGRAVPARH